MTTIRKRQLFAKKDRQPSERMFGILFSFVFSLIGLFPLIEAGATIASIRWWLIFLALVFLITAVVRPLVLRPLSRAWQKLGLILARIINPLVMATMFFVVLTPIALIKRLFGAGSSLSKPNSREKSYWIIVEDVENDQHMKNQF